MIKKAEVNVTITSMDKDPIEIVWLLEFLFIFERNILITCYTYL